MKITTKRLLKRPLSVMRVIVITMIAMVLIAWVSIVDAAGNMGTIYTEGGILDQKIKAQSNLMIITLIGITHYEVTELFNDILSHTPGVAEAERYRVHVEPGNPKECIVVWHVRIKDTDSFQLEHNLYSAIRTIAKGNKEITISGFTLKPTDRALKIFKNIRPYQASIRKLEFVYDQPLTAPVRDKQGTYIKQYTWRYGPNRGFE